MGLTKDEKKVLGTQVRQMVYVGMLFISTIMVWKMASVHGADSMWEYGIVENCQLVVLAAALVVFLIKSRCREHRPLMLFMASLVAAALIRENDSYFDHLIPIISWKFCFIFPLLALANMYKHRQEVRGSLLVFLQSTPFYMLLCAVIVILPVAQCVGHRSFIMDAMGIDDVHLAMLARRTVEETLELLGYIQILMAGIECYFISPAGRESNPQ